MTTPKILTSSPTEDHLSVDQIYLYLEGNLATEQMQEIEAHLLDCNLCREATEGLTLISEPETQHALFEINRNIKKRTSIRKSHKTIGHIKNWGLTTAILFLLLFAAVLVWYEVRQMPVKSSPKTEKLSSSAIPVIGMSSYTQYLQDSLRYPIIAKQNKLEGIVEVQFTINPDGTFSNINILKGLDNTCNQEAVRLLQEGPKWQPAIRNGRAIPQSQTITIPFKLAQ